ncbi:MAG: NADP-dependent oxidoreductase, partial [Bacteroidota bacterium]|nr:NADP-dependent oxidoreductase [Bacteroidota bacterium]
LEAGQRILIHGAAGGVGTFAVQLAKWKGAYVIGTASESNIDFLKELGADEVIDYKKQKFEELLNNIDVVFDLIGGDTQKKSVQVLKEGGILVSTLGIVDKDLLAQHNIKGEAYMAQSIPEQLNQMAALIDEGKLKPIIAKIMPLEQAAEAQKESEAGHVRGKIVLEVRK